MGSEEAQLFSVSGYPGPGPGPGMFCGYSQATAGPGDPAEPGRLRWGRAVQGDAAGGEQGGLCSGKQSWRGVPDAAGGEKKGRRGLERRRAGDPAVGMSGSGSALPTRLRGVVALFTPSLVPFTPSLVPWGCVSLPGGFFLPVTHGRSAPRAGTHQPGTATAALSPVPSLGTSPGQLHGVSGGIPAWVGFGISDPGQRCAPARSVCPGLCQGQRCHIRPLQCGSCNLIPGEIVDHAWSRERSQGTIPAPRAAPTPALPWEGGPGRVRGPWVTPSCTWGDSPRLEGLDAAVPLGTTWFASPPASVSPAES